MKLNLLQQHTINIYGLADKECDIRDVPARSLLTGQRFDLFAKLYYIRNRQDNRRAAMTVYCQHIKAFNPDLKEPGSDDKDGYDDFINTFDALIDDLCVNGFNPDKSIIPVDENGIILDGAHRVAALAYADKTIRIAQYRGVRSKAYFNYEYFLKRGLSWKTADLIALEMVQWCPNMLMACLWPRMGTNSVKKQTQKYINMRYPLCYVKTISTNLASFGLFIRKVYANQDWIGNESNNYAGAMDKALQCFASNRQICIVLMEADSLNEVIALKEEIRHLFQCDKHSIHITDNSKETREIAQIVFDDVQLSAWNNIDNKGISKLMIWCKERAYYFKYVTIINCKVAIAHFFSSLFPQRHSNNKLKNL